MQGSKKHNGKYDVERDTLDKTGIRRSGGR
jgi:hypothetical protein